MDPKKEKKKKLPNEILDIQKTNDSLAIIGREAKGILDVKTPETLSLLSKMAIHDKTTASSRGDMSKIVGRDKETGFSLEDGIMSIFNESTARLNAMSTNRFIRHTVIENRWMVTEMPHLKRGFAGRKTNVFTPDDVTKGSFIFSSPQLQNPIGGTGINHVDDITMSTVKKRLEEEINFTKLMNDAFDAAQIDQFVLIYDIKLSDIAKQLLHFAKNKNAYKEATLISEAINNGKSKMTSAEDIDWDILESAEVLDDILEGISPDDVSEILECFDVNTHYLESGDIRIRESVFPMNEVTDNAKAAFRALLKDHNKEYFDVSESKDTSMRSFYSSVFGSSMSGIVDKETKTTNTRLNITGLHTEILDSERVIPVMIGGKLLGAYYLENTDAIGFQKLVERDSSLSADYRGANSSIENVTGLTSMIRKVIERNIDVTFLKNNKHILPEIRSLLNSALTGNETFKLRYIPAKNLQVFTDRPRSQKHPLGESILQDAKAGIYSWIMEHKNIQLTELYHKHPKMIVGLNVNGLTDDMLAYVQKAMKSIEEMYSAANLQNIYDVPKMYKQMSSFPKIVIPKGPDGASLIDIDIREGQKTDDNIEVLKMYERIVSVTTNMTVSSFEENYNFATTEINQTKLMERIGVELQKHQGLQISQFATNYYRKLTEDDKDAQPIDIIVTLPPPRLLNDQNNSSIIDSTSNRAEKLATLHFGEATLPEAREFIRFYANKYLEGIENIREDFDAFQKEYAKIKLMRESNPDNHTAGDE